MGGNPMKDSAANNSGHDRRQGSIFSSAMLPEQLILFAKMALGAN